MITKTFESNPNCNLTVTITFKKEPSQDFIHIFEFLLERSSILEECENKNTQEFKDYFKDLINYRISTFKTSKKGVSNFLLNLFKDRTKFKRLLLPREEVNSLTLIREIQNNIKLISIE